MAWYEWAVASLKKSISDWFGKVVFAVATGVTLMVYQPTSDFIMNRWNATSRIEQQLAHQDEAIAEIRDINRSIRADIEALRKPSEIFEVSQFLSGPVGGYCRVPGPCEMEIWVRRVRGSEQCKIVPGMTEHNIVSRATGVSRKVDRVGNPVSRNIGLEWEPISIVLDIPRSIPTGDSLYIIVTFYTDCPGMSEDDQAISDESYPIELDLRG